jgi:hypothetical protein
VKRDLSKETYKRLKLGLSRDRLYFGRRETDVFFLCSDEKGAMGGGVSKQERRLVLDRAIAARNKHQNENNLRKALAGYRAAGILPEEMKLAAYRAAGVLPEKMAAAGQRTAADETPADAAALDTLQTLLPPHLPEVAPAEDRLRLSGSARQRLKLPRPKSALSGDHYRKKLQQLRLKRREPSTSSPELRRRPDTAPTAGVLWVRVHAARRLARG